MNILHVSAECYPFVKVGGLADVVGSLPGETKRLRGADVRVILPKYKAIPRKYSTQMQRLCNFTVDLGNKKNLSVGIDTLKRGNIVYYFIDNPFFFGLRDQIYNYGDESERFAFFQIATLEAVFQLGFLPDIIHVHDWHTAMIPLLVQTKYQSRFHAKTVLTIHNLAYQGIFPIQDYQLFDIEYDSRMEFEGFMNFLKAGIVAADLITTVSKTYANEILTDYYGYGMQRLLRERGQSVQGILNGISYKDFDPETDRLISVPYGYSTFREGKKANKKALGELLKIEFPLDKPLIGIVSRLVNQKGFDLVRRVFDEMLAVDDFYLVVLGDGEFEYVDYFKGLEGRFPKRVKVKIGYDNRLSHMIYAGSDLFLMPSKFEPCGLGQMIALKYGSIPIVRETGGLVDTVQPFNEYELTGNGFSFTHFNAHDMMHVIRYSLTVFSLPEAWNHIVKNAMASDYSWTQSAKMYKQAYKTILKKNRKD